MAKNVLSLQLLRNSQIVADKAAAISAIQANGTNDGVIKLARYYTDETSATTKTIFGVFHDFGGSNTGYTIYDADHDQIAAIEAKIGTGTTTLDEVVEMLGSGFDSGHTVADAIDEINDKLGAGVTSGNSATQQFAEINNKLGTGVTTTAGETVTDQIEALKGTTASTSADTSIAGAKKYTDDKIATLDYPDTALAKSFVTEVDETDGVISVQRGEITSSGKTIVLSDGDDDGVNFEVNIDGLTIVKDANTGVLSVANSALVEYVGDNETIAVSAPSNNQKTISSLLTITATTPSEANVKEQYNLVDATGGTIGDTIKIYKDSALLSVALLHADTAANPQVLPSYNKSTNTWTDIDSTAQTQANQALCYAYEDVSGNTVVAAVPVGSFINEQEFASGVTWDSTENKVRGVVDPTSEVDSNNSAFLTVGANGFKVDGIKNEIAAQLGNVVEGLDATVTGETSGNHVTISIEELDGKLVQSGLTIQENDIASQTDLAALSAKTVTVVTSSNNSISTASTAADGTVSVDVITDASKIQMSGFTSTDALSGIAQSSSITEAFQEVDAVITANEQVTAQALNDLESTKVDVISVNGVQSKTPTTGDVVATVVIDGGDVVLGPDYTKPAQGSAIATGDTVDEALGKLEAKVDAAVASGVTAVSGGSGISVDSSVTTQPVVSVDLKADAGTGDNDWHNPLKFDTTDQSLYFDSLDCGFYN